MLRDRNWLYWGLLIRNIVFPHRAPASLKSVLAALFSPSLSIPPSHHITTSFSTLLSFFIACVQELRRLSFDFVATEYKQARLPLYFAHKYPPTFDRVRNKINNSLRLVTPVDYTIKVGKPFHFSQSLEHVFRDFNKRKILKKLLENLFLFFLGFVIYSYFSKGYNSLLIIIARRSTQMGLPGILRILLTGASGREHKENCRAQDFVDRLVGSSLDRAEASS